MTWTEIRQHPVVLTAIHKAEKEIKKVTSMSVKLSVESFEIDNGTIDILMDTVCEYAGIPWHRIIEKGGKQYCYDMLHTFMYLAVKLLGYSRIDVAAYCERADHTSVINAIRKIEGFYDVGDPLIDKVEDIKKLLKTKLNANENTH